VPAAQDSNADCPHAQDDAPNEQFREQSLRRRERRDSNRDLQCDAAGLEDDDRSRQKDFLDRGRFATTRATCARDADRFRVGRERTRPPFSPHREQRCDAGVGGDEDAASLRGRSTIYASDAVCSP